MLITCAFPATDAFLDGVCHMSESVPATSVGAVSPLSCHCVGFGSQPVTTGIRVLGLEEFVRDTSGILTSWWIMYVT